LDTTFLPPHVANRHDPGRHGDGAGGLVAMIYS
jgi:hypothetical protein